MKFTFYTHILEKRHKDEHSYTLETDNLFLKFFKFILIGS